MNLGKAFRNLVLGIGILILTMFVVVYGISTFYPSPEYEDYCDELRTAGIIENQEKCEDLGGRWTDEGIIKPVEGNITGYCDRDYTCRQNYEEAQETRSKSVFIIAIPLAILLIALGAFVFHLDAVGLGLMFGGVGTLIYGAGGYWRYSDNLFKFIISLTGLAVLIFLAYWFNKKFSEKEK